MFRCKKFMLFFAFSILLFLFLVQFSWSQLTSNAEFTTELNNLKGKFQWGLGAYELLESSLNKVPANVRTDAVKKLSQEIEIVFKGTGGVVITRDMVVRAIFRSESNPEHLKVLGLYEEYLQYQSGDVTSLQNVSGNTSSTSVQAGIDKTLLIKKMEEELQKLVNEGAHRKLIEMIKSKVEILKRPPIVEETTGLSTPTVEPIIDLEDYHKAMVEKEKQEYDAEVVKIDNLYLEEFPDEVAEITELRNKFQWEDITTKRAAEYSLRSLPKSDRKSAIKAMIVAIEKQLIKTNQTIVNLEMVKNALIEITSKENSDAILKNLKALLGSRME